MQPKFLSIVFIGQPPHYCKGAYWSHEKGWLFSLLPSWMSECYSQWGVCSAELWDCLKPKNPLWKGMDIFWDNTMVCIQAYWFVITVVGFRWYHCPGLRAKCIRSIEEEKRREILRAWGMSAISTENPSVRLITLIKNTFDTCKLLLNQRHHCIV